MTYNIHPLFVHFPIALLFLYSIIKIIPFKKWFPEISWKDIERVLLLVGVLGAFAALTTGEIAEGIVQADHQLVEAHALFATISTWVYVVLFIGELVTIPRLKSYVQKYKGYHSVFMVIERVLSNKALIILLSVIGLVAISITGMLGGVIVYGLSADPIAPLLLSLLGITL